MRPTALARIRARYGKLILLVCLAGALAANNAVTHRVGVLEPGKFAWEPEVSPSGPLVVIISLADQTLSAYRNGIRIAYSSISSGVKGRSTPAGVFTVLEKEVTHFSNKYHHAPMPFMQRLTWEGVALHGGDLPGYPASHGCIRLPREFAKKLYSITTRGTTVIVVDDVHSQPTVAVLRPGILLPANNSREEFSPSLEGEFEWNPQRSPEGPVTILASGADRTVYVYRNGIPIGRASFEIDNPKQPLGSHAFTMLEGVGQTESVFVPGRPAHRWLAVRTDGNTTLEKLGRRLHVSPAFAEKVYDIVSTGTTVVVTDAPGLRSSPTVHALLMQAAEQ